MEQMNQRQLQHLQQKVQCQVTMMQLKTMQTLVSNLQKHQQTQRRLQVQIREISYILHLKQQKALTLIIQK